MGGKSGAVPTPGGAGGGGNTLGGGGQVVDMRGGQAPMDGGSTMPYKMQPGEADKYATAQQMPQMQGEIAGNFLGGAPGAGCGAGMLGGGGGGWEQSARANWGGGGGRLGQLAQMRSMMAPQQGPAPTGDASQDEWNKTMYAGSMNGGDVGGAAQQNQALLSSLGGSDPAGAGQGEPLNQLNALRGMGGRGARGGYQEPQQRADYGSMMGGGGADNPMMHTGAGGKKSGAMPSPGGGNLK